MRPPPEPPAVGSSFLRLRLHDMWGSWEAASSDRGPGPEPYI